ncbi:MAG: hypothetical protein U0J41_05055 [Slackia isoflavoniconvertens]|nr:hypothetical protein [Slackia isoflavoniconvertens]
MGYENYVEYVFATEYGRDYTMAEIEAAQDEVAREFVPVYQSYVADVMGDDIDGAFDALDESEETLMANARACVARVSPALGESFDLSITACMTYRRRKQRFATAIPWKWRRTMMAAFS